MKITKPWGNGRKVAPATQSDSVSSGDPAIDALAEQLAEAMSQEFDDMLAEITEIKREIGLAKALNSGSAELDLLRKQVAENNAFIQRIVEQLVKTHPAPVIQQVADTDKGQRIDDMDDKDIMEFLRKRKAATPKKLP